ncbi:glycosyltransferase family 2 protein [Novosphingobium cyanobacteriorum]|uniref:Glycosyltransferase n=1 Tax=Novosphingobium cyanobacteriorum TaxID=3024215 RepID=A0ABT6CNR1_9SPHN|nr:hypothetical protein [Novosphingobium cyanobacteriorum]MDF8335545.1 hypothetical protein [Novosphingobium cyanobacteriorum]
MLLTTADLHAGRDAELARLVRSVEQFQHAHPETALHHVMLLQRCTDPMAEATRLGFPARMDVFASERQIPLSSARNIMINRLLEDPPFPLGDAMVAFPDDDAWYPAGTLEHMHALFSKDRDLDFWFCRYGSEASFPDGLREYTPALLDIIGRASSNTIAVRGAVLANVRGFDESLGLGTPAKSGEDTDFAMRAAFSARKILHAPERMVGHRDFDPAIRARYYGGTLVALRRHRLKSVSAFVAYLRKIAVGVALCAKGELPVQDLRAAWKMQKALAPAINPKMTDAMEKASRGGVLS